MHRRNPSTPIRRTPFKSRHDFSGNENSSAFLPSHYHTPTRPSNYRTSSGQGPASPMIACSNHTLNSISYNGRNRLKFKPYLLMGVAFVGILQLVACDIQIQRQSFSKMEYRGLFYDSCSYFLGCQKRQFHINICLLSKSIDL